MKYSISRAKHRNADFKDVAMEKQFLGGLINNKVAFIKIVSTFNSDVFTDNRLKKIYDGIVKLYLADSEFVVDINILNILSIQKSKLSLYRALFKKINKAGKKKHKTGFLLTCKYKLEQLYQARVIEIGVRDTVQTLMQAREGDFKVIENASDIVRGLSTMVDTKAVSSIKLNPIENYTKWADQYERWRKHPDKMRGVPTGIRLIDNVITGLRPSEFGLCIAGTGIGKSIFLLECAINCWLKTGDIIYVTIEMPAEQLENRFWCNLTGIPYNHFRELTLTEEHRKDIKKMYRQHKSNNPHNFHIIDMNEGCTVTDIQNRVQPYIKGDKIKLICVDYMNIIAGNDGKVSLDWETQVGIAMNIKQSICRRFEVPTWSACQVTGDNVAFGSHIKDNIDIGVKFTDNEDTDGTGMMDITYPKGRDFRGKPHQLKTMRHIMRMSEEG